MLSATQIQTLKPVIVLIGPTAIGKSRIAIEVAKELGTEILTADSRQVYRGMDIGTDKPTTQERQGVPHRLIDLVNPDQHFSVGDYRDHAVNVIGCLHKQAKIPLIAGGTGLYIRTLLRGLWEGPPANWNLRQQLDTQAREKGAAYVHQQLSHVDPALAERIHPNDYVKVQRGLEVYHALGIPLSEAHEQHNFQEVPYPSLVIGLNMDREHLYRRIENRVHVEIQKGLIEETRSLLDAGYHRNLSSMKSLGYKQMAGYIMGDYPYEEAVRILKRDTRHFAKRQITWFRKEPSIQWLTLVNDESATDVAGRIMGMIQDFVAQLNVNLSQDSEARTTLSNAY